MIKALTLENFQSHENTTFSFHPGVNVICGRSDSGKSAIVRALKWICFNEPDGSSFISHWDEVGRASLWFDDDTRIIRTKVAKKQINTYQLNEEIFSNVGRSVPTMVSETLNLDVINFQGQLDSPFLIGSTPGAISRHFNEVASIDTIDTALANINKWATRLGDKEKDILQREENLAAELEKYSGLDELEELLTEVNAWDAKKRELYDNIIAVSQTYDDLNTVYAKDRILSTAISELEPVLEQLEEITYDILDVEAYLRDLNEYNDTDKRNRERISVESSIDSMLKLVKDRDEYAWSIRQLGDNLGNVERALAKGKELDSKLEVLLKEVKDNLPEECPICGGPLEELHYE